MTDLQQDLAKCMNALERATPDCSGDRASRRPGGMECEQCGSVFIGDEAHSLCGRCHAYHEAERIGMEFLRQHHAAIAEAVRDAERYRWLRDEAHPDSDDGFAVLRQEYSDWGKPYPAHITGSALDDLVDAARATKGGVANTEGLLMTDPPNPGSDEAEDEIENFEAWFEQRKKESWAKALLPGENKPCPQNWGAAYKPYFREAWLARAKFAA